MADSDSKDNFTQFLNKKKEEGLWADEIENLNFQYDTPNYEDKFVKIIEQMQTIPFVLLGHFQFITVNWIDEDDNLPIVNKVNVEDDQEYLNHWELVKRMIFSQSPKKRENKKPLKDQAKKDKASGLNKITPLAQAKESQSNVSQIVDQFSNVYNYFKDFMQSKKIAKRTKDEKRFKNEKSTAKRNEKYKKLKNFKQKINFKKVLKKKQKNKFGEGLGNKSSDKMAHKLVKKTIDKKRTFKRTLGKRKEVLIDLNEISKRKQFFKLNLIMSKDDGPFMTDYRFLLGIEFWANYCGVEKHQLISACSNNFWLKNMTALNTTNKIKNSRESKLKNSNLIKELKQFLKGTDRPANAPQRITSPEDKFRIIPYPKLFNPNTDLKKTFHSNTIQDQLKKKLKDLYSAIVFLIGGKYPLKRHVDFEEAYEDILLWVLDNYQSKTRFIALLNDHVQYELLIN